jgi:hypothetical protein
VALPPRPSDPLLAVDAVADDEILVQRLDQRRLRQHLAAEGVHDLVLLEPGRTEQVARDSAVHHLQHNRRQLGLCSQQLAQGDRQ